MLIIVIVHIEFNRKFSQYRVVDDLFYFFLESFVLFLHPFDQFTFPFGLLLEFVPLSFKFDLFLLKLLNFFVQRLFSECSILNLLFQISFLKIKLKDYFLDVLESVVQFLDLAFILLVEISIFFLVLYFKLFLHFFNIIVKLKLNRNFPNFQHTLDFALKLLL